MTKLPLRALGAFALLASTSLFAGDLHLGQTFQVGGSGGFDYITSDAKAKLLFIPRSTHTLVLDEETGKQVADIQGQAHNHGVAVVPEAGRGFISDGAGFVHIFDLKTYQVLGKVKAADDADGIIYDKATDSVLCVCGDASCLFPIPASVDPTSPASIAPIDLGGKPEFLAVDGKGKAYVNLQDKDTVAVVDLQAKKVIARYPVAPGGSPVGMSIDKEHGLLFIGCRKPQVLLVMNAADGKVVASLPIGAGVDATAFDDGSAYASCRDGTLTVAREVNGTWAVAQTVKTQYGAKTLAVDSKTHVLYLPTAEFAPGANGKMAAKPGSFVVLTVSG